MDYNFVTFLQLLEILAFFSGYPMIYLLVQYLNQFKGMQWFTKKAMPVLPHVYSFLGLLFLGLQLKTLSYNFNLSAFQHPYLVIWGITSLLFLFPILYKQPSFSLLHSLVFLFVLIEKILFQDTVQGGRSQEIRNYMSIYSISLALNLLLLLLLLGGSILLRKINILKNK